MSLAQSLKERSQEQCELCGSAASLQAILVSPRTEIIDEHQVVVCPKCKEEIENPSAADTNHWRLLNDAIWSPVPAIQVISYRMLKELSEESWAQDLMGMLYLDEETLAWAEDKGSSKMVHKDSNGNVLETGDTVTLTQDLKIKGANFTAKRGTAVRRIRLVPDNAGQIEGKVDGQQIVILTKYVKKN